MKRKLLALLLLIATLGAIISAYLYFFVYYTSTLTIEANVDNYSAELFSKKTAKKWMYTCPEMSCSLNGIAPLTYNLIITKENYIPQTIPVTVGARRKETIVVQLEKQPVLVLLEDTSTQDLLETPAEKIERIRKNATYSLRIPLDSDSYFSLQPQDSEVFALYEIGGEELKIQTFNTVDPKNVIASRVSGSQDIFFRLDSDAYLYSVNGSGRVLKKLPFSIPVEYVKSAGKPGEYYVVTGKGTFAYSLKDDSSEYQYLFRDFVAYEDRLIGIIFSDENQKKTNFGITESGNVIVDYNPVDKTRKVIYILDESPIRIEKIDEKIIITTQSGKYELINF